MKKKYIYPTIEKVELPLDEIILTGSDTKNQSFGNKGNGNTADYDNTIPTEEGDGIISLGKGGSSSWDDDWD